MKRPQEVSLELHITSEDVRCIESTGSGYSLFCMRMIIYIRRDSSAHGVVQVLVANDIFFSRSQLEVVKDVKQLGDRKRHL